LVPTVVPCNKTISRFEFPTMRATALAMASDGS